MHGFPYSSASLFLSFLKTLHTITHPFLIQLLPPIFCLRWRWAVALCSSVPCLSRRLWEEEEPSWAMEDLTLCHMTKISFSSHMWAVTWGSNIHHSSTCVVQVAQMATRSARVKGEWVLGRWERSSVLWLAICFGRYSSREGKVWCWLGAVRKSGWRGITGWQDVTVEDFKQELFVGIPSWSGVKVKHYPSRSTSHCREENSYELPRS